MSTPVLQVERLYMAYRRPEGWLEVLRDLSFQVAEGEFVTVIGPSGCGKTTLLRLIAGLIRPVSGQILLRGNPVFQPSREVGFVFQQPALLPWRTALENVALPLEVDGCSRKEALQKARALLRWVGLEGFENAYPTHLSGGMAQRVALARALIHDPSILLLDEPFGSLDALTRETLARELARLWEERRLTVLMVTHSVSEAVFLADRVLVLTPRPTTLAAEVPVSLPRPRDATLLEEPAFIALVREVRERLNWAQRSGSVTQTPNLWYNPPDNRANLVGTVSNATLESDRRTSGAVLPGYRD
ncbi:MAG: ABC transporter ATP-binding protein [Anaerolineae bacterium]|nr:ABC transporter ATP-binding protein [Anaerolineae bacterium]MCX8066988.1 ABC transporter ATP-binding protein [Anaerolineae bacterium]MDW7991285.1 ABC transporter ATP-binding protein [Anaerolineae bacterium]